MALQSLDIKQPLRQHRPAPRRRAPPCEVAKLIDVSRCIGCKACQSACMEWNDLRDEVGVTEGFYTNPPDLSDQSWTLMRFNEERDRREPAVAHPQGRLLPLHRSGLPARPARRRAPSSSTRTASWTSSRRTASAAATASPAAPSTSRGCARRTPRSTSAPSAPTASRWASSRPASRPARPRPSPSARKEDMLDLAEPPARGPARARPRPGGGLRPAAAWAARTWSTCCPHGDRPEALRPAGHPAASVRSGHLLAERAGPRRSASSPCSRCWWRASSTTCGTARSRCRTTRAGRRRSHDRQASSGDDPAPPNRERSRPLGGGHRLRLPLPLRPGALLTRSSSGSPSLFGGGQFMRFAPPDRRRRCWCCSSTRTRPRLRADNRWLPADAKWVEHMVAYMEKRVDLARHPQVQRRPEADVLVDGAHHRGAGPHRHHHVAALVRPVLPGVAAPGGRACFTPSPPSSCSWASASTCTRPTGPRAPSAPWCAGR